jgi:glucosylceramidase
MSGYEAIPDFDSSRIPPESENIIWKHRVKLAIFLVIAGGATLIFGTISREEHDKVTIYQTSKGGDRLTRLRSQDFRVRGFGDVDLDFKGRSVNAEQYSHVHVGSTHHQEILGFGGAFTEAASNNFYKFPEAAQEEILELYFGRSGLKYTMGRIHINSCDFSPESYSFDEVKGDYDLRYFDREVTHDEAFMLPFMRAALTKAELPIKLVASPWSPPAWMKVPVKGKQSMTGSAEPNGLSHEPLVRRAWAKYMSIFIESYKSKGVPIWALTPQNEPEFAAPWEACKYDAETESAFIQDYLGPTIKKDHPDVLILAFDHNKDHLFNWTKVIMKNDLSGKGYVDGMAFHWYTGNMDRALDGTYGYGDLRRSKAYAPGKIFLATEGCSCPGVKLDNWLRAERTGHDILYDLLNFAQGWIDWNLIVDFEGGFNHLGNNCDAPIVASKDFTAFHVQPKYFYMGHYSKFLPPGSFMLSSSVRGNFHYAAIDPYVRDGMELGLYTCERSTRQMWSVSTSTSPRDLKLTHSSLDTEVDTPQYIDLCVKQGTAERPLLALVTCKASDFSLKLRSIPVGGDHDHLLRIEDMKNNCLTVSGSIAEAGAPVVLAKCAQTPDSIFRRSQSWFVDRKTGEIIPGLSKTSADPSICLTAGSPFLSGAAFQSIDLGKVVILINEASVNTTVSLSDPSLGHTTFAIEANSIQTLLY